MFSTVKANSVNTHNQMTTIFLSLFICVYVVGALFASVIGALLCCLGGGCRAGEFFKGLAYIVFWPVVSLYYIVKFTVIFIKNVFREILIWHTHQELRNCTRNVFPTSNGVAGSSSGETLARIGSRAWMDAKPCQAMKPFRSP